MLARLPWDKPWLGSFNARSVSVCQNRFMIFMHALVVLEKNQPVCDFKSVLVVCLNVAVAFLFSHNNVFQVCLSHQSEAR